MIAVSTALILVGYQKNYFADDGIFRNFVDDKSSIDRVLANTMSFILRNLSSKLLIISTPLALTTDCRSVASQGGRLSSMKQSGAFRAGSTGAETVPELTQLGDRIVYVTGKVGFNAFSNTWLEMVLVENKIKDVLIAGMDTSLCIDSTGRAAYERGFDVTILSDCTAARTAMEQDYFCEHVFPLYGRARSSTDVWEDLKANCGYALPNRDGSLFDTGLADPSARRFG